MTGPCPGCGSASCYAEGCRTIDRSDLAVWQDTAAAYDEAYGAVLDRPRACDPRDPCATCGHLDRLLQALSRVIFERAHGQLARRRRLGPLTRAAVRQAGGALEAARDYARGEWGMPWVPECDRTEAPNG